MNKEQMIKEVNSQLKEIFNDRTLSPQERGEMGEAVVTDLVKFWSSIYEGSIVETSFIYEQGPRYPTKTSSEQHPVTETDILVVTPYCIFVIEVKTIYGHMKVYDDSNIEIIRKGEFENNYEDKNFIRQNEMHCRHLYYHLHDLLPDGNPIYIKPIIVMTGKMKIEDTRIARDKNVYPIVITNKLIPALEKFNKPRKYILDINKIQKRLDKVRILDKERLLNSQNFNKK